ncbi:hypothetical protein FOXB_06540 [Fusarium oxysporum f. sp. conglutinans Fo5176]|uniref:Uncharacterized protein n=1 Tax=Fusarium oxysporum (strain Fo5176) TaxID=660025 RepID=F9FJG1_FUSOF|nr:hypothetical protein FOXB_06540 [Fusarium oxysporum f. sp. conglutinans Fo5176]
MTLSYREESISETLVSFVQRQLRISYCPSTSKTLQMRNQYTSLRRDGNTGVFEVRNSHRHDSIPVTQVNPFVSASEVIKGGAEAAPAERPHII